MLPRIRFGTKIIGGYLVMVLLVATIAAVGVISIRRLTMFVDAIVYHHVPAVDASMEMMITAVAARDLIAEYRLADDPALRADLRRHFQGRVEEFLRWQRMMSEATYTDDERRRLEELEGLRAAFVSKCRDYLDARDRELLAAAVVGEKMERYDEAVRTIAGSDQLAGLLWMQAMAANDYLITGDEREVQEYQTLKRRIEAVEGYEGVTAEYGRVYEMGAELLALGRERAGEAASAQAQMREVDALGTELGGGHLRELEQESHSQLHSAGAQAAATGSMWLRTIVASSAVAGLICFVLLFVGSIRDVADQRMTVDALRESERRFREVLENIRMFAVMIDLQGMIHFCNDHLLEKLEWRREELVGRSWFDMVFPPGQNGRDTMIEAISQGNMPDQMQNEITTRTGRPILVSWYNTYLYRPDGTVIGATSIGEDVSERKRMEESMRNLNEVLEERVRSRTKSLIQANEELRQFSYVVSHDLRGPLNNIHGFAGELELALGSLQRELASGGENQRNEIPQRVQVIMDQEVPEALHYIRKSAERMDGQVSALLALSRLGYQTLKIVEVHMDGVVERILGSMSLQVEQKGVNVTVRELPTVRADADAVEMIMANILDNAVKYLDPDRAGEIAVFGERKTDCTEFHVRDNGVGIADEDRHKVFTIFRRINTSVSGEGVGLSHVQTLVRRHGGRIWFESEVGVGTTFSFAIPDELPEAIRFE